MSRLHLVTSRVPLPGALAPTDQIVFLDSDRAPELCARILAEQPASAHVLTEENTILQGLETINNEQLVALCAVCESIVSW